MITFVYCCICLLIVCCQTIRTESVENDYNNDSPDTLPKVEFLQYKMGADVLIRCNQNFFSNKDNITWEFKHCDSNYRGIHCDDKSMYKLDYSEGQWKKLDFNRKRKKLEMRSVTKENTGLYRCLYNDSIIKIYMVYVMVPAKFAGPRPEILSLVTSSNSTITPNTPVVIQCKAQSVAFPAIRWFRECPPYGCEVHSKLIYHGYCYCGIPSSHYAWAAISDNVYVSKLSIYNTRSFDSGTYVCSVVTMYGEAHGNITIQVDEDSNNYFQLLFLIPLVFVLLPVIIWVGFYRRKKKNRQQINEHQKRLIKPVVEL